MTQPLLPGDFYIENGRYVFTAQYHLRRGTCCGNACRHCPYAHANVPAEKRAAVAPAPAPAESRLRR